MRTQRTLYVLNTTSWPEDPSVKEAIHASDDEPANSDEDQYSFVGVEGKYVLLMLGDCPGSAMDTSSIRDGRRQSLWPARVSVGQ